VRQALNEVILNGRFAIAYCFFVTGTMCVTATHKMLPKGHPSRTYIEGRVGTGAERIRSALRAPRRY
jgi:hypothetical protein